MYSLLIVDDEPLICKGLTKLLASSGLSIDHIYVAYNAYEALDYLRMEEIDLLVTDIQLGAMNGIELMHEAKLIKPWVQTIIVSAHESFQYAQLALKLGAKDYLIKPLNSEQFLDSVRNVLLKMNKPAAAADAVLSGLREQFSMEEPAPEKNALLGKLLENSGDQDAVLEILAQRHGISLYSSHFSIITLNLNLPAAIKGQRISAKDNGLLQYAAMNIANELMGGEWNHAAFYSGHQEVTVMIQWEEKRAEEMNGDKINQLDMIGRSLHFNIHKYLGLSCTVGISQILKGTEYLATLSEQARRALLRHADHPDHYVFYYGDFDWSRYAAQEPTADELNAQHNVIVDRAKSYIDENYAQKGLTLHEVAQRNHVSPNYLSYLFKKKTGCNLWEYVIKLRMEESRRLLTTTDLRRYEISEQVGYESPEHFSKIFKKYFGISPSELKK